jgi:hypothetical protein
MDPDESSAGPAEIQPTVTRRREKVKNSFLRSRLLMRCQVCGRVTELATLWAVAADMTCDSLCDLCQMTSLFDAEIKVRLAELRVVSKGLEPIDRK